MKVSMVIDNAVGRPLVTAEREPNGCVLLRTDARSGDMARIAPEEAAKLARFLTGEDE